MHEKYFQAKKENFNEGMKEISAEKQEVNSVYRVFMALNIVTQSGLQGLPQFTDIVRFFNLLKPFSIVENI